MACTITSPTVTVCNDLTGGIAKLELAAWSAAFDSAGATWVEFLLSPNSSDWDEVATTDSNTKVTTYSQTLNFIAQGIASVANFSELASGIVAAKLTDYEGNVMVLGAQRGMSNNGSKAYITRDFEGGQGFEASYACTQSISYEFTKAS